MGGVGGAQPSAMGDMVRLLCYAMVEGVRGAKRQSGVLDEGDASGSGGVGQAQPADKCKEFGYNLCPPAEVRVSTAPLRKSPLIRKRLGPAVNAAEGSCSGNDREDDEAMPPRQDENAEGRSTVSAPVDAKGVLAMADSVPPDRR